MSKPTILINAYKRPQALERLLNSLLKANIPEQVDIWFSLEFGAAEEVVRLAEDFYWKSGKKYIIKQEKKQGLVGHFLFCGDLTQQLGTIIYLEDDLFVGTDFYDYSLQVLEAYESDDRIAGFSLNALWFNGYLHSPFHPISDGNPVFFLQVPWYQGQIYTARQWRLFREWLARDRGVADKLQMHPSFINYQLKDDWFPLKTRYLIEENRFYCYPRTSQVVNFGDKGTHFAQKTDFFMTEISMATGLLNFVPFDRVMAVYDSFFEILPEKLKKLNPNLENYDLEIDLNGTKDLSKIQNQYLISCKASNSPIYQYAIEMRPPEINIICEMEGQFFTLAPTRSFSNKHVKNQNYVRFKYHYRHKLGIKSELMMWLKRLYYALVKV